MTGVSGIQQLPFLRLRAAVWTGADQERPLEARWQSILQDSRSNGKHYTGGSRVCSQGARHRDLVCTLQPARGSGARRVDEVRTLWHFLVYLRQANHAHGSDFLCHIIRPSVLMADLLSFVQQQPDCVENGRDITSRLVEYPDYAKRLQVVGSDHLASAFFCRTATDAVFRCLLRFGAKHAGGGVLGHVKGSASWEVALHGMCPSTCLHIAFANQRDDYRRLCLPEAFDLFFAKLRSGNALGSTRKIARKRGSSRSNMTGYKLETNL